MARNQNGMLQERLHSLLLEAEQEVPGSQQRTQSLEQILGLTRSILQDRGTGPVRNSKSPPSVFDGVGFALRAHGGGSLGDDHVMLEEHGSFSEGIPMLDSIPESSSDRLWNEVGGYAGDGDDHAGFDSLGGTFAMDDVDEGAHAHPHALSTHAKEREEHPEPGLLSRAGGAGTLTRSPMQSLVPPASTARPQALASPARVASKPAGKAGQMSNLAREEQASIPHLPASGSAPNAPPLVTMQLEPDKRLSHKEVEQRRREKAKQYFDELRGLLPFGSDSAKFDKNAILHHSIILMKQLMAELAEEEAASGVKPVVGQAGQADFRNCFDVSREPLCFAGTDSRLWDANASFCTLMGYTRMEIGGLSFMNATAPSDQDGAQQHWNALATGGGKTTSRSYKCKLVRKDGLQIAVNIDLNLVMKGTQPHCFLVAAHRSV
eukprot:CAMPEP_0206282984 /NCGR_PEP_ID=MMETSP0047_2-20121206/39981_1 /ASSEMBLY_ACC=CAM_ASM_000192 /TAXON_ID=195065 /ORGANISM="Chroomonas mesostigmatica_cf, Strain CCMP1168" /LENGTH=434 /DNA_ID=CAMNT_0053713305 /DNA_START=29 /DNA_END=1333 /DNA_ORIENTATION=-